jgi:hypothetical protein
VVSQNVAKVVDQRSVGTVAVAASFTAEPLLGVIEPEREILAYDGLREWVYCPGRFEPYG